MQLIKNENIQGINFTMIPDKRFKSACFTVSFHVPLTRETATKNALLAEVLQAGCEGFRDKQQISSFLEENYGSSLIVSSEKRGDQLALTVLAEVLSDEFVLDGDECFSAVFGLAEQIILRPIVSNGEFDLGIVNREKETLKKKIEGIYSRKRKYSVKRAVEEMCSGEPHGISGCGYVDDIDGITPKALFEYYNGIINTSPVDIFVAGNFDAGKAERKYADIAAALGERTAEFCPCTPSKAREEVKRITERDNVTQGKLVMGFKTGITAARKNMRRCFFVIVFWAEG